MLYAYGRRFSGLVIPKSLFYVTEPAILKSDEVLIHFNSPPVVTLCLFSADVCFPYYIAYHLLYNMFHMLQFRRQKKVDINGEHFVVGCFVWCFFACIKALCMMQNTYCKEAGFDKGNVCLQWKNFWISNMCSITKKHFRFFFWLISEPPHWIFVQC